MRRANRLLSSLVLLFVVAIVLACGGDDEETEVTGTPTPTPFCATDPIPASEVDLELPRFGGSYTRHVPVEGWVDARPGRLLRADVLGPGGGVLASSQVEVGEEERGEMHRIEGSIILQSLPEKQDACFTLRVSGSTLRLPIVIGGANP